MGKNKKRMYGGRAAAKHDARPPKVDYNSVVMENEKYEKHYKESNLIPEEEWEEFWSCLRRTLPTTFRFTGSKSHALSVLAALQDTYIPHLQDIIYEGEKVDPPTPLPWYPDSLAWSMSVGKNIIRRHPAFKKFQKFLVQETAVGNISRQEAVSMVPPLLMDIKPGHVVLDMCAAPGSKTAQLIEMLHMGEEKATMEAVARKAGSEEHKNGTRNDGGEERADYDYGRPTGLVIANDADYKRSHMLIHQTKRLNSPNLIVTNNDASGYPSLIYKKEKNETNSRERNHYLKYDRILADVPCSGDGTPRKNYNVWREWTPIAALNLHIIQVRILVRGLQMLKVGGRIVYSTCSMNPVENEAVVAAAISRCGGPKKVRVLDVSDQLPGLERRPGLKGGWRVMDREARWWDSYDDATKGEESGEGWEDRQQRMVRGMWYIPLEREEDRVPTERTLRIYPHLQDTGGFYVAVLEKVEEVVVADEEVPKAKKQKSGRRFAPQAATGAQAPVETEGAKIPAATALPLEDVTMNIVDPTASIHPPSPVKRPLESPDAEGEPPKRRRSELVETEIIQPNVQEQDGIEHEGIPADELPSKPQKKERQPRNLQPSEEPFNFLPAEHSVLQQIREFYSIHNLFPSTNFMVRNAEAIPTRAIYYSSSLAKNVLEYNAEGKTGVKFVHSGVKVFVKQDARDDRVCPWRIQSDGINIVEGWLGKERVIVARKRRTVKALLKDMFPRWKEEDGEEKKGEEEEGKSDYDVREIREQIKPVGMGCCVLRVEPGGVPEEEDEGFKERMVLPLWKSGVSVNLMLPKEERRALLSRIFNDDSEIIDNTRKNRQNQRPNGQNKSEKEVIAVKAAEEVDGTNADVGDEEDDEDGGVPLPAGEDAGQDKMETD